jgi:ABC-type amino acid transport substrate-binding protein
VINTLLSKHVVRQLAAAALLMSVLVMGWVAPAQAKEITIGSSSFSPYHLPQTNSGIFPDIITAVFREMPGYEPKYVFDVSVAGILRSYQAGRVDAISNLFDSMTAQGCRTEPLFRFSDVVISKVKDDRQLESLADLDGLNVIAFEGATGFFGDDYAGHMQSESYLEVAKPELQSRMLLSDRYDVSVGDLYIFLDSLKRLKGPVVDVSELRVHHLFAKISSRMGFHDTALCPVFDRALAKVKASGEYERIYWRYLNDFGIHQ